MVPRLSTTSVCVYMKETRKEKGKQVQPLKSSVLSGLTTWGPPIKPHLQSSSLFVFQITPFKEYWENEGTSLKGKIKT